MPMTDDEARRLLLESPNYLGRWARDVPGEVCEAVWHALQALADRRALVEASWSTSLPDGILLRIDAARRHMEGSDHG